MRLFRLSSRRLALHHGTRRRQMFKDNTASETAVLTEFVCVIFWSMCARSPYRSHEGHAVARHHPPVSTELVNLHVSRYKFHVEASCVVPFNMR